MLSWFSNESHAAPVISDEPPETPAHTFVTRAFKQAIFGTPAPPQTQRTQRTRTLSMDERRATHPSKTRSGVPGKPARARSNSVDASPAKPPGILLTPGTGGNRRKSVTFDAKDAKKLSISRDAQNISKKGLKAEDFHTRLRGADDAPEEEVVEDPDVTMDMSKPRSSSGKYWRDKYETLDKSASHDIRKLKKKEEVAKKFGVSRDTDAQKLEDDLRREQSRADELQQQVDEYRARLKSAIFDSSANVKSDAPRRRTREEIEGSRNASAEADNQSSELEILRTKNKELEKALTEQRKVATVHLKSKETEIAHLKSQLQDSQVARQRAEEQLAETRRISSQHLRNKEREISRMQRGVNSKQADEPAVKRLTAPPISMPSEAARRLSHDPASDIWADAVGNELQASPHRSPRRRQTTLLRQSDNPDYDAMQKQHSPSRRPVRRADAFPSERAPLSARPMALLNSEAPTSYQPETPRSKALSDERREAARRRLEERKRSRDAQGGVALNGLGWQ